MGTIAEISLSPDEFALRDTFGQLPDVQFEVARVVAHNADRAMPFIWVAGEALDEIDDAFEADPSVENVTLVADLDGERLYQMDWVEQIEFIVHVLVEEDATVLSAQGSKRSWHLRVLFPDRDALSKTFDFSREHELSVEIEQIYELENAERGGEYGLTEGQYETLVAAHDEGYYHIPRGATQEELAEVLGISRQALSERFRRGHGRLVENALIVGEDARMNGSRNL